MHHASGISGTYPKLWDFYPERSVMEQKDLCRFENTQFPLKYISYHFLRDMKAKKVSSSYILLNTYFFQTSDTLYPRQYNSFLHRHPFIKAYVFVKNNIKTLCKERVV